MMSLLRALGIILIKPEIENCLLAGGIIFAHAAVSKMPCSGTGGDHF